MARTPARIVWSEQAFASFQQLPYRDRSRIRERVHLLETFPEMYALTQGGRWAGLRRFFAGNQVIFYGYWASENTVYVEVVAPARLSQDE